MFAVADHTLVPTSSDKLLAIQLIIPRFIRQAIARSLRRYRAQTLDAERVQLDSIEYVSKF